MDARLGWEGPGLSMSILRSLCRSPGLRAEPVNPLHEVVQEDDVGQAEAQEPQLRRKRAHVGEVVELETIPETMG